MESNKKLLAFALASMVALSAMGGALAAAPTVDTETANSATTSDLVAGGNVDSFNASSDRNSAIEGEFDSTNASINITHPETGYEVADWSTSELNQTYSDDANNDYHYRINFSHDELADVPVTAGEQETITVHLINDTNVDNPDVTSFNVTLNATNERTVRLVTDDTADSNDVEMMTDDGLPFLDDTKNTSQVSQENVGIANGSTDLYLLYANDTVASDFQSAQSKTTGILGFGKSEPDAGAFLQTHTLKVDGEKYAVFNSEPASWAADEAGMTYGVATTVDGKQATKVTLSDESFDGETEVDSLTTKAGNKDLILGPAIVASAQQNTFGGFGYLTAGGFSLGTLLLIGGLYRRRSGPNAQADGGETTEAEA